ncbi:ankyrin repeat domain-containing protein [Wolbachia endosymbiont of Dirofilaria (Dirofilaria) immitis]|uniref:ankyrin repeat domain-containing protein n=1 Tax=Wolbachia endosymbiont of Dirofilaria (Dirofilaria) immitis TaxID=1812115 RepID=UPI00159B3E4E|nr:hypothetical protein GOY12_00865 [Wolbachia endosymbiont of Dirofilaria (Dirofilaria) immitis]
MKSVLCFALIFGVFGLTSLFAVEQLEEKKVDADRLISPIHEDVGIEKDLKQDLPESVTQQGNDLESFESEVGGLSVEKIQNNEARKAESKEELQRDRNEASVVEKAVNEVGENNKDLQDFSNNLLREDKNEVALNLPSVVDREVNRNFIFPPGTGLSGNVTDLQVNRKVDVEKNKRLKNNINKLLEERKLEGQVRKERVKKLAEGCNIGEPIIKKDEKGEREEESSLQRWARLNKEPVKEWHYKNAQDKLIYKRQYDTLNEHLPTTVFIGDYSKQLFYCIKKGNLICLRGIISKLEKLGLTVQEVLKFRNKLGDTPLIYAVKQGEIDVVRFLLLQGADTRAVNHSLKSSIDIAIEKERIDMVNAIAEMMPCFLEHKEVDS